MIRHVAHDLYQLGESETGKDGWCEAVRVYVLLNDGCPLIFDAGSHIHRGPIMKDLVELLGETAPGYVFLTHTELPHTGNLSAISKTWPEAKFVISSAILPHVEMPWWVKGEQIQYGHAGSSETYGNRRISFSDAILKDQPGTHWMFDEKTGVLFTADAFGYLFPQTADQKFDDELEDGIPAEWSRRYHESAFRFLPMVSGEKVSADLRRVFAARDVKIIAPTHGNAVRGNINRFIDRVSLAMQGICQ
ncbi:hypothetical protein [Labrenzia sp. DG1229]|uniref:hypothetical protein n=1 Tax=Labrenzia sp. DG1229 TaxID=681847 RepID=UPI00048FDCF3|nr:hypothetical protein [Labrenzia sp. DG1229]